MTPAYVLEASVVTLKLMVKLEVLLAAVSSVTAASITVYPLDGVSPLKMNVVVRESTVCVSVKGVWLSITRTA